MCFQPFRQHYSSAVHCHIDNVCIEIDNLSIRGGKHTLFVPYHLGNVFLEPETDDPNSYHYSIGVPSRERNRFRRSIDHKHSVHRPSNMVSCSSSQSELCDVLYANALSCRKSFLLHKWPDSFKRNSFLDVSHRTASQNLSSLFRKPTNCLWLQWLPLTNRNPILDANINFTNMKEFVFNEV